MRRFLPIFLLPLLIAALVPMSAKALPGNPIPENVGLYNYSTPTLTTNYTAAILPRNVNRNYLFIQNHGAVNIVIKPGSQPTGAGSAIDGIVIGAGSTFAPTPPWVDSIYGNSWSSTATLTVIEGIK